LEPNLFRVSFPVPFSADDEIAFDDLACLVATRFPAADWLAVTDADGRWFVLFTQERDQRGGDFVVMLQLAEDRTWEAVSGLADDGAVLASSGLSAGDAAVGAGIQLLRQWLPKAQVKRAPAVVPRRFKAAAQIGRVPVQRDESEPCPELLARGCPLLLLASGDGNALLASYRSRRMENAHRQAEHRAAHLAMVRRSHATLEAAWAVIRRVEEQRAVDRSTYGLPR
jgi:hypothetical protein